MSEIEKNFGFYNVFLLTLALFKERRQNGINDYLSEYKTYYDIKEWLDSTDPLMEPYPHQFATALFSFLYHLASYDAGGEALVSCGMMEALLKVQSPP